MTKPNNTQISVMSTLYTISLLLGGCVDSSSSPSPDKGLFVTMPSGSGLAVHFIDAGQDDSILVESDGHYMPTDANENNQAGTVVPYLKAEGVTKPDYVTGAHPHSDHIGDLDKIVDTLPVDKVLLPPMEHTTRALEDVLDSIAFRGLRITKLASGDSYDLGGASFIVFSPVEDYDGNLGNWSVRIYLTCGDDSFVMCDDVENQAEEDIVNNGTTLKADALKAGHRGSGTSTSGAFPKKVSLSRAIIQCGKGNFYGRPHKETIEKLKKAGCQILRTDEEGTVATFSDGETTTWSTGSGTFSGNNNAGNSSTLSSYIINTNIGRFHRPDCASIIQMKPENQEDVTVSRDGLAQEGYEPCKQYKP